VRRRDGLDRDAAGAAGAGHGLRAGRAGRGEGVEEEGLDVAAADGGDGVGLDGRGAGVQRGELFVCGCGCRGGGSVRILLWEEVCCVLPLTRRTSIGAYCVGASRTSTDPIMMGKGLSLFEGGKSEDQSWQGVGVHTYKDTTQPPNQPTNQTHLSAVVHAVRKGSVG
jgi:hypothetical protein